MVLKLCFTQLSFSLKAVLPCLRIILDTFSTFHQGDSNLLWNRVKEVKGNLSLNHCCESGTVLGIWSHSQHHTLWGWDRYIYFTEIREVQTDRVVTDHANWNPDLAGSFWYTILSAQQTRLMVLNFSQLWTKCGGQSTFSSNTRHCVYTALPFRSTNPC